jgi:hypothetical protein
MPGQPLGPDTCPLASIPTRTLCPCSFRPR